MSNIVNLEAEEGANIIGDDAQPTLALKNTSTGPSLKTEGVVMTGRASISAADVGTNILAANATVANLNVHGSSVASGAVLALKGDAMVSVTSIKFITGGVAGTNAIRIAKTDGTFGWIPVLPDAAVTAAPVAG